LLFHELLGELANRQGTPQRAASLSVEFLSLTPRNRVLSIMARAEPSDGNGTRIYASLADAAQLIAEGHGRFLQI
jgi:hypothetical protein